MLDLSALDEVQIPIGAPLMLNITDVIEDPDQPRNEFNEDSIMEMAESIRERVSQGKRGIISPISVKPLNAAGKYVINHGARRYRASLLAEQSKIPAFIDDTHDDYDQTNENLQRENLTPMELALFIEKRLKAGDSKAEIARRLSREKSFVTEHTALIDAPELIVSLYRSGRCMTPRYLYELRSLYEKHPEDVTAWVEGSEITRKAIDSLKLSLKGDAVPQRGTAEPHATDGAIPLTTEETSQPEEGPAWDGPLTIRQAGEERIPSAHYRLKNPLLTVRHGKRLAIVLLDKKPTEDGLVFIKYQDGHGDDAIVEVPGSALRLISLEDASKTTRAKHV